MGAAKRLAQAWPIIKPIDVYSHLADPPEIVVCVDPKGAAVSENSRKSFTSKRHDVGEFRLKALRSSPIFYKLRDALKLRNFRKGRLRRKMVLAGQLPADRRWIPMPSGRNITFW
jgi:hypothetical protein